jgi:hypothetical protein
MDWPSLGMGSVWVAEATGTKPFSVLGAVSRAGLLLLVAGRPAVPAGARVSGSRGAGDGTSAGEDQRLVAGYGMTARG